MSNQHHFESSSATSTSQVEEQSWISWLVGVPGNHFLCEVDRAFIEDSFNLFGLKQMVSADFNQALEIILDRAGKQISGHLQMIVSLRFSLQILTIRTTARSSAQQSNYMD